MRAHSLTALLGTLFVLAEGCSPPPPPVAPRPPAEPPSPPLEAVDTRDAAPRVVRRLLSEERELVKRSLALATELPDPRGRERALLEVRDLERELAELDGPLTAGSEKIDAVVAKLLLVDTRVSLLHERLRGATSHTTAIMVDSP